MESWGRGGAGARARAGSQMNPSVFHTRGSRDRGPQQARCKCHGPIPSLGMTLTAPSPVSFLLGRSLLKGPTGNLGKGKWTALHRVRGGPEVLVLAKLSSFIKLVPTGPLERLPVAPVQALGPGHPGTQSPHTRFPQPSTSHLPHRRGGWRSDSRHRAHREFFQADSLGIRGS